MSFSSDLSGFAETIRQRQSDIFVRTHDEVHRSLTEGSEITGAPGQPVDTGELLESWIRELLEPFRGRSITNTSYARAIEDGIRLAHTRQAHTRRAHERGEHTRDGVRVRAHRVSAHEVRAHEVAESTIQFRSPTGGPHSVKLTRAGFGRIVQHVAREVVG